MKKFAALVLCFGLFSICTTLNAQDLTKEKVATATNEEDEGPIMFKFEPDVLVSLEERRAELQHTRSILDTMDISDRKRKRILRDLYRKKSSKRLSKVLVTTNTYEDSEQQAID